MLSLSRIHSKSKCREVHTPQPPTYHIECLYGNLIPFESRKLSQEVRLRHNTRSKETHRGFELDSRNIVGRTTGPRRVNGNRTDQPKINDLRSGPLDETRWEVDLK